MLNFSKIPALGIITLLSACAVAAPKNTAPAFPTERHQTRPDTQKRGGDIILRTLEISGLKVQSPEPFAVPLSPLCDVAQMVFGVQLGVPFSCVGEAEIALASSHTDPEKLVKLFALAVQSSGGSVVRTETGFSVSSKEGRGIAMSDNDDEAPPMAENLIASVGYTIDEAPTTVIDSLSKSTLSPQKVNVEFLSAKTSLQEYRDLASVLGLSVQLVPFKGYTLATGTPYETGFLRTLSYDGIDVVGSVPLAFVSESDVESFERFFPDLRFHLETSSRTLSFRGDADTVASFYQSVASTTGKPINTAWKASIYSIQEDDFDLLSSSFSASFRSGDFSASLNQAQSQGVFVKLDQLREKSRLDVLSEPNLTVLSGSTGAFNSGLSVSVLDQVDEDGNQSFKYIETGTTLSIVPVVAPSGMVRALVRVELSQPVFSSDTVNPNILKNHISTEVDFVSGDTLFLGGLDFQSSDQSNAKRLFLPSKNRMKTKSKVLIALTLVKTY